MKHPIPIEALDKHIAFLGGTGSGKTSGAKSGVVEPSLEAGERVLVIDPTSAWWGLRLGRDGKSKGFPVYIFGGDHGDYPLRSRDAEVLAETFATSSDSAIFDTSLMTVAERTEFFTGFAEAIRRKNRGPLKLVIDEAHLFMPQSGAKSGGAVPAMLHAGNNLVSLGRSRGLRITLISQRPAKLHKDSLTQVQSLVAMRLLAPQDRSAVNDWIADQADLTKGKDLIASLPTLKPGEGIVWAPLVGFLDRVAFPLPRTFDSSRAPEYGDGAGPTLAPVNLDALKSRLATIEAEAKANDPRALKAEIVRLKSEAAKSATLSAPSNGDEKNNEAALVSANRAGFSVGWDEGWRRGWKSGHEAGCEKQMRELEGVAIAFTPDAPNPPKAPTNIPENIPAAVAHPVERRASNAKAASSSLAGRSNSHDDLTGPQRRVMSSLAFWASVGHEAPTRAQVAAVAGYSPSSGGFNNLIGGLNTAGKVSIPAPGRVALAGAFAGYSADEAVEKMRSVLSGPQLKLVDAAYGWSHAVSRDQLASFTGYSSSSGGFNNLIGSLCTLDILRKPAPGMVEISDWAREVLG